MSIPPGSLMRTTDDIDFTGNIRVNGATGFVIADPTDATKTVIFNLSGLPTATQTEFTVPDSDSSLVTLTATQTLTNKKLDDTTTTFIDTAAPTKVFRFECGSITAGQTRVVTVPDSNGTMAYLAGSTFTTAILTAPTINAATLTGAISGGTVAPTILTVPSSTALTTPAITGGTWTRTAQVYYVNGFSRPGAGAGWLGSSLQTDNLGLLATAPAAVTAGTLIVPVTGLKVGWTITGFYLVGQIESAGATATLDADMRLLTAVAADVTDASLGTITQISVTADTAIVAANSTKTLASPHVILATETVYILLTATTAALTDIALQGVAVIVTEV